MAKNITSKPKSVGKNTSQSDSFFIRYRPFIIAKVVLILTLIFTLPSLYNDFTNWDDNVYVTENERIRDFNAETVRYFFDTDNPVSLNYHPITMISLAYDFHRASKNEKASPENPIAGHHAIYYHTTNLIFHLFNTLLVFWLIWLISDKRWLIAGITALIFGIHPMHVESFAWISERKDVLYTFFYLLALISYLRYLKKLEWYWLLPVALFFIASLLSKGVAVSLPVVLFLMDYLRQRKFGLWQVLEKVPFLVVSVWFGLLAIEIQSKGAIAQEGALSLIQRIVFASYGFVMYLYKMILPVQLSTFYPYPELNGTGSIPSYFYLFPFLALGILGSIIYFFRKNRDVIFGFGFFLITIALVLQFLPVGKAVMADRYSYVPFIGIGFMLALLVQYTMRKAMLLRVTSTAVILIWFLFLGIQTKSQIKVWENSGTLWTQVIENYPNGWVAYKNRGNYYGQQGNTDLAMKDYLHLQQNGQMDSQVFGNMGNIYRMNQDYEKALESYEMQVKMDTTDYKGYLSRGITQSILGSYDKALADYYKALQKGAPESALILNRGITYNSLLRFEEAIADFTRALQYNPYSLDAFRNRGFSYFQLNQFELAKQDFEQALQLTPNDGSLLYNLSVCYFRLNDKSAALRYAQQAEQKQYPITTAYKALLQ